MSSRIVIAFLIGAVLAGAVVYFTTKPGTREITAAPAPPVEQAYVPPAEQQDMPVAEPEPAPLAARPSPVASSPAPPAPAQAKRRTGVRAEDRSRAAANPPAPAQEKPLPRVLVATPPPVETPPAAETVASVAPPPREVERVPHMATIPAGTIITVRVDQALSSEVNNQGDTFKASLDAPLVVDGFVLAERGARVQGRIAEIDRGGRVRGTASMGLQLTSITTSDGQKVSLETERFARQAPRERSRDAAKVGAAAGIGAAIGAIAGGGKGAALGAVLGGAAGAGGVMATRGAAAEIAPETRVSFRLAQPVTVTEKL